VIAAVRRLAGRPRPTSTAAVRIGLILSWYAVIGAYFLAMLTFIVVIKGVYLPAFWQDPVFGVYGLVVTIYLLSRFALSVLYRPVRHQRGPLPTVAIVIPAMNEEDAVEVTIDAAFSVDYPPELLSVYVVDDGSTDGTWDRIREVAAR